MLGYPWHATTTRRHFWGHLARGAAVWGGTASAFLYSLQTQAADLQKRRKSAILLWMGGGPSTLDLWDLKPGTATGGPFQPRTTRGDLQICEHLPLLADQMQHLSVIRSMSTREADHMRGRYYLHTGYVPDQTIEHPSYGAVIAKELLAERPQLEIPPFVSVGGGSVGAGFLGMAYAPFVVNSDGRINHLEADGATPRLSQRMAALQAIESSFATLHPRSAATEHTQILQKTVALMTSEQRRAFRLEEESTTVRERYGENDFGRGCLMARRLVEAGVPFIEVDFGGWDHHADIFTSLKDDKLPILDRAMSALVSDLETRELLRDTVILWMGEFGRTPRINGDTGRDHFARAWSVVVGGGGMRGGQAIGQTSADGSQVESEPYAAEDLMATVCQALGISLETKYTSRNGRPMKIANGGKVIPGLI